MERINIEFTLFSAFYSPLISVISDGELCVQPRLLKRPCTARLLFGIKGRRGF
jgi:hypothetical protein